MTLEDIETCSASELRELLAAAITLLADNNGAQRDEVISIVERFAVASRYQAEPSSRVPALALNP
jgi:hypothetical protein